MHWLGPYIINGISNDDRVQPTKLNGEIFLGRINGSRIGDYKDDLAPM